jgi:glycine/D-amino acid oxidase-like deaminating enzyme
VQGKPRIAIIGAGLGGTAAAVLLQNAGFNHPPHKRSGGFGAGCIQHPQAEIPRSRNQIRLKEAPLLRAPSRSCLRRQPNLARPA